MKKLNLNLFSLFFFLLTTILSAEEKIEAEKNHEYILQNPDLAKLIQTRKPETGEDILAILADETIPWETRAKLDLLISGRREESEQILAEDSIGGSLARTKANLGISSRLFTSGITTTLNGAITSTATSLTLTSNTNFEASNDSSLCYVKIDNEVLKGTLSGNNINSFIQIKICSTFILKYIYS